MIPELHIPLSPDRFDELAEALGDTPETVVSVHLLRRRRCRAHLAGDPTAPVAAIIQADKEPMGFGADPSALWRLLEPMEDWVCISVPVNLAHGLGEIVSERRHVRVRYLQDVYHALIALARVYEHDAVRELTSADLDMLESAPSWLRASCWGTTQAMLEEGIVAGGIVGGRLVSAAFTTALSDRHADIGVNSLEAYRRRGLATAAVSLVARRVQEMGRTPVWSAGEHNAASLAVARKVGFPEVLRRTYVILDPNAGLAEH